MATATWYVNKDSRIAFRNSDSANLGSGTSTALPTGQYAGYIYRALLGFDYSFSGMLAITSAVLHIRTSTQVHVAFGSDPDVEVRRITASWSEGSSNALSGSNAVIWPGPSSTTLNSVQWDVPTSESTWTTVDITAMIQDALAAGVFHGLNLRAVDEGSSADVGEFSSREAGSSDAYIFVNYSTNNAPTAPTLTGPADNSYATGDVTIAFTQNDAEGDAINDWQVEFYTDAALTALLTTFDSAIKPGSVSGQNVSFSSSGLGNSLGQRIWWRARTKDAVSLTWGAWSGSRSWTKVSAPTTTLTEPSGAGRLAKITMSPGWSSPRMYVTWNFSCPEGGTQTNYTVEIVNDSSGSPGSAFYLASNLSGTDGALSVPATFTEGNYYHVRVKTTCSHGIESAYSGYYRIRVRWGVAIHRFDTGATPTQWSVGNVQTNVSSGSSVVVEYGSDASANSTPSSGWKGSLSEAPLARYFFYRVWLMSWGASPATSPSLDRIELNYSSNVLVPDSWSRNDTNAITIDEATFVYGTQSLKIARTGADLIAYQTVPVVPNTDYVLSGRIKSLGNSASSVQIVNAAHTQLLAASPTVTGTQEFTPVSTPVWNSGSATAVIIRCNVPSSAAAGSAAWFDALKFEASKVVTPWTPGFLGDAVVFDVGGLQIDGLAGGIFRLRGSSGGSRDRVDLGPHGLKFGGDVEVYSPSGDIRIDTPANTDVNDPQLQVNVPATGGTDQVVIGLSVGGTLKGTARADDSGHVVLSGRSSGNVYLGWDSGSGDVVFGNGSLSEVGRMKGNGAHVLGGASFPGSPSSGWLYYRTDLRMWFVYDGSRWLSTELFTTLTTGDPIAHSATGSRLYLPFARGIGSDIYVDTIRTIFFVSGGTLDGSNKWVLTLSSLVAGGTFGGTVHSIQSGSVSAWRETSTTLGSLLGGTEAMLRTTWTKTGAPGDLTAVTIVTYRIVAT